MRIRGCVFLALLAGSQGLAPLPSTQAQGFGPDPYKPYNFRYEPFVYPVAPGPLDYGYNQGFAPTNRDGLRRANQFGSYLESLRGTGNPRTAGSPGAGAGTPYFRSDRTIDKEFERVYQYRPNRQADEKFEASQEEVSNLYFRYLREKDPKKRAQMFREYNRVRSQVDRELSGAAVSRSGGARRPSRKTAAPRPGDAPAIDEDRSGPPPPAIPEAPRSGRAPAALGADPAAGPPPSPLDEPVRSGETSRDATPSRVLDRALRQNPAGRGPTRRSTAPPILGPAPPP